MARKTETTGPAPEEEGESTEDQKTGRARRLINVVSWFLRSTSYFQNQLSCDKQPGTTGAECAVEAHMLTYVSTKAGGCYELSGFQAVKPTGQPLLAPEQLKNKLRTFGQHVN